MNLYDEPCSRLEHSIAKRAEAKPASADWLLRQAEALGLSFLRKCKQLGYETPEQVDALRKRVREEVILLDEKDIV